MDYRQSFDYAIVAQPEVFAHWAFEVIGDSVPLTQCAIGAQFCQISDDDIRARYRQGLLRKHLLCRQRQTMF